MSSIFSEADISKLVRAFYTQVRVDGLLAPVFAAKIKDADWPAHMDHIADFWSSIFLKTRRFEGNPMRKHFELNGLTPAHFERWLSLFQTTAERVLSPEQSRAIHGMAERIAQSFQMGLAFNLEKSGETQHPFREFSVMRRGLAP